MALNHIIAFAFELSVCELLCPYKTKNMGEISHSELFEVWHQLDARLSSTNKNNALKEYVLNKLNISPSETDRVNIIQRRTATLGTRFEKKFKSAGRTKERFQVKYRDFLQSPFIFTDTEATEGSSEQESVFEQEATPKVGRPEKSFEDCSEHTKRVKIRNLLDMASVSEINYAAQMATRASGSRTAADLIKTITTSTEAAKTLITTQQTHLSQQQYSPEEALAFYVDNKCTQRVYKNIRKGALAKKHYLYPSYHALKTVKNECLPPDDAITVDEVSVRIKLQQLLDLTVQKLIKVLKPVIKEKFCSETDLTLVGKWGADGSSSQSVYKQKFSDDSYSDATVFMISFVPIKLYVTNEPTIVIWQNSKCSSTRLCRPIAFVFAKETRERVLTEVNNIRDQISNLQNLRVVVENKTLNISYDLVLTMIDGKITNILTDNRDTQKCYLCGARAEQLNSIGQDRVPKTEHYVYGLSTLHAWIRFLEFCLKISYNIDVAKKQKEKKDANDTFLIETRKDLVQKRFKSELGLNIDKVTPGYGSSNDGNTSRSFFKNYRQSADITGVDEQLLKRFFIILSVMSSGYDINYASFGPFLEDTKKMYLELYPWCNMTPTVHKILFHGLDVMKQSIVPIGLLSEEAQESRNKDFRRFRLCHTRKSSRLNTNQDLVNMLLITSDPLIDSLREIPFKNMSSFSPEIIEHLLPPHLPEPTNTVSQNIPSLDSSFDRNYIMSDSTDYSDYESE